MWDKEKEEKQTLDLINGYVITGFRYTCEGYPEIRIENRNDVKYILISRDSEDNGPGEFFIERGGNIMARKKNPFGKKVDVDNPYAIYKNHFPDLGETEYRILKTYQHPDNERKTPFARWFVAGKSDATHGSWEYGDMYANEFIMYFFVSYETKEWGEYYR